MAHFEQDGAMLPGIAPVAMSEGRYVARRIAAQACGRTTPPFRYFDKGKLATIGRSAAVADLRFVRYSGFFAWLTWLFVHLLYLVEFENRLLVLVQWAWIYFTRNRGARLITGIKPLPLPITRGGGEEPSKRASKRQGHEETKQDWSCLVLGVERAVGVERRCRRLAARSAAAEQRARSDRSSDRRTRSFSGMMPLSVMLMCSGQTSVQHRVMLQLPEPNSLRIAGMRSAVSSGCISRLARRIMKRGPTNLSLLVVVAQHVADVLAQVALDALAELLHAIDVLLVHPVACRRRRAGAA